MKRLLLLLLVLPIGGGAVAETVSIPGLQALDETQYHKVESKTLDRSLEVLVGLPNGYAESGDTEYPTIYILDGGAPFYAVYACKDGGQITLCCLEVQFYAAFVERAGLKDDAAFASQFDPSTWPEMKRRLTEFFLTKTRDEWAAQFGDVDACLFPVLGIDEAPRHAHNAVRGTDEKIEGSHHAAPGPRFSETPAGGPDPVEKDLIEVAEALSAWSA